MSCHLLDEKEVVVDASPSNEGTLVSRNKLTKPWSKAKRHDLGEELGYKVNKTNRAIVEERGRIGNKVMRASLSHWNARPLRE